MSPIAAAEAVKDRLGRELPPDETTQATAIIATVTGLIADTLGTTTDAVEALDPVPTTFITICVEKAALIITNPTGLASESEQLGSYQHSMTYQRANDIGIYLSDDEQRRVRRAAKRSSFVPVTLHTPYSGDDLPPAADLPL
jgi:hypothetical protein